MCTNLSLLQLMPKLQSNLCLVLGNPLPAVHVECFIKQLQWSVSLNSYRCGIQYKQCTKKYQTIFPLHPIQEWLLMDFNVLQSLIHYNLINAPHTIMKLH